MSRRQTQGNRYLHQWANVHLHFIRRIHSSLKLPGYRERVPANVNNAAKQEERRQHKHERTLVSFSLYTILMKERYRAFAASPCSTNELRDCAFGTEGTDEDKGERQGATFHHVTSCRERCITMSFERYLPSSCSSIGSFSSQTSGRCSRIVEAHEQQANMRFRCNSAVHDVDQQVSNPQTLITLRG